MKKFLELSSWSRKAAIGSMLIVAFAVVGCDDSSSASAGAKNFDFLWTKKKSLCYNVWL